MFKIIIKNLSTPKINSIKEYCIYENIAFNPLGLIDAEFLFDNTEIFFSWLTKFYIYKDYMTVVDDVYNETELFFNLIEETNKSLDNNCDFYFIKDDNVNEDTPEDDNVNEDTYITENDNINEDTPEDDNVNEDTHITEDDNVNEDTRITEDDNLNQDTYITEDDNLNQDTYITEDDNLNENKLEYLNVVDTMINNNLENKYEKIFIKQGTTYQLPININEFNNFVSLNIRVATIYKNGIIEGITEGTTMIQLNSNDKTKLYYEVTVYTPIEKISLKNSEINIRVGVKHILDIKVYPERSKSNIKVITDNLSILKIENTEITGLYTGKCNIKIFDKYNPLLSVNCNVNILVKPKF